MANIFKLLNRKPKIEEESSSVDSNLLKNRTIFLDFNKKKEDEKMTDTERALKVPNQNSNLTDPAPLPDVSKMADAIGSSAVQMKTFDIVVFDMGDDGRTTQKEVNGVKAQSAQELMTLYGAEGSKIKILREYGNEGLPQPMKSPQNYPSPPSQQQFASPQFYQPQVQQKPKDPPKYFEIGGVKCKLENGKMYQEQWMRVDSTKYRLIADATNKMVSMNGKHLEMLKWVQIENEEDETNG